MNVYFQVKIEGPVILAMALIFIQGICGMSYGKRKTKFKYNK